MTYSASNPGPLVHRIRTYPVFEPTDFSVTSTDIQAVAHDDSPSLSDGYPGFKYDGTGSPAPDFSALSRGEYVLVSGFTGTAANNNVFRVHEADATELQVDGVPSSQITADASGENVTIRRVRVGSPARFRSITGASVPLMFQASTSTDLSGAKLMVSLNGGLTWEAAPEIVLPDTQKSNALVVQVLLGYDALFYWDVPAAYAGTIYAA